MTAQIMASGMVAQTSSQRHYRGMLEEMSYEQFLAGTGSVWASAEFAPEVTFQHRSFPSG